MADRDVLLTTSSFDNASLQPCFAMQGRSRRRCWWRPSRRAGRRRARWSAEAAPWRTTGRRSADVAAIQHRAPAGAPTVISQRSEEGADDFIEPDVEATKDGHLVCFHDTTLDDVTDVADQVDHPEFAGRRRTLEVQWANVTGYFISSQYARVLH
jgi:hypothetical protein